MTYCRTCQEDKTGLDPLFCAKEGHELEKEVDLGAWESLNDKNDDKKENPTQILLPLLMRRIKKFAISSNDASKVFAIVDIKGHNETIELGTQHALSWFKVISYNENRKLYTDDTYTRVINLIRANALYDQDVERVQTYRRIAVVGDEIYYDLGRQDWKIVKITKDNINIIPYDENVPLFIRNKNQAIQPDPNLDFAGNPLSKFCQLLRIKSKVFPVHFVSLFIENIPVPIMIMLGPQGSIKSTQSGYVKSAVDPAGRKIEDNLSHLAKKQDDIIVHLSNNYLVAFDNVSYISNTTSDTLCKAITGAGYPKRELYSDGNEITLRYQRKIVLNGISFDLDRGDLVERAVIYNTDKILPNERRTAQEVDQEYQTLLPDLLGHVFVTLQKALRIYHESKSRIKNLPRMADFVIWGEAISIALGNKELEFSHQYKQELEQSNDILNESNPLIPYLDHELAVETELLLPVNVFYQSFKKYAENNQYETSGNSFPQHSNKIRGFITRTKPSLDDAGYKVEIFKNTKSGTGFTKNQTMIRITRQSPSSLSSPTTQNETEQSDAGERGEDPQVNLGEYFG